MQTGALETGARSALQAATAVAVALAGITSLERALESVGQALGEAYVADGVWLDWHAPGASAGDAPCTQLATGWVRPTLPTALRAVIPLQLAAALRGSAQARMATDPVTPAPDEMRCRVFFIPGPDRQRGALAMGWVTAPAACGGADAQDLDAIAEALGEAIERVARLEAVRTSERSDAAQTHEDRARLLARQALLETVLAASNELLLAGDLQQAAARVTERIGRALRADRLFVTRILPPDEGSREGWITAVHEWAAAGVARQTDDLAHDRLSLEHYAEYLATLRAGQPVAMRTEEIAQEAGRLEQAATGSRSQFQYPILVDGELWGTFAADDCHAPRAWNEAEVATLQLAATAFGSLVRREQLASAQRAAERELAEERARMAREIHDTLAQGFTGVIMQLHATEDALEAADACDAARHVTLALDRARMGLAEARRSVYALRPPLMDGGDLAAALRTFTDRVMAGGPVRAELAIEGDARRLEQAVAFELFRIAQEALSNVLRHAQATRVGVRLAVDDGGAVLLEVADDGQGFVPGAAPVSVGGFGLVSMRERAARLGARFELDSAPAAGTRVRVRVPGRTATPADAAHKAAPRHG